MTQTALTLYPANERGIADFGWLKARHSFSFGSYYDPGKMGFANLRVINDDIITASKGFALHPHQNAEIFSYVLSGEIEHKDTLGNGSVVTAGGIQYMSAGSGVHHSEFNPSNTEPLHLLQTWLHPAQPNTMPRYQHMQIPEDEKDGRLKLFLSHDGRNGSIKMLADASIYAATLNHTQRIQLRHPKNRNGWLQLAKGSLEVNGRQLQAGDGLAIAAHTNSKDYELLFSHGQDAEFLYFDLAG